MFTEPYVYITGYKSYVVAGQPLELTCEVDHMLTKNLPWTYRWYFKPKNDEETWTFLTSRKHLIAPDTEEDTDSGLYRCVVKTPYHEGTATIEVTVKTFSGRMGFLSKSYMHRISHFVLVLHLLLWKVLSC